MRAYTTSYIGPERQHLVENSRALVALQMQTQLDGLSIVRVELTAREASELMVELGERNLEEWVQFGTLMGIPCEITKEPVLCDAV